MGGGKKEKPPTRPGGGKALPLRVLRSLRAGVRQGVEWGPSDVRFVGMEYVSSGCPEFQMMPLASPQFKVIPREN